MLLTYLHNQVCSLEVRVPENVRQAGERLGKPVNQEVKANR